MNDDVTKGKKCDTHEIVLEGPERCEQSLESRVDVVQQGWIQEGCIPPPTIFKNAFNEYNFS